MKISKTTAAPFACAFAVFLMTRGLESKAASDAPFIPLPEVRVTGKEGSREEKKWGLYNPGELSLKKSPGTLKDTPQSISVIPKQVIDDQGVTTLRDTLRNVSGISIAAGEGGNQGDSLTIRGFSARSDLYVDGMRDFGSYYRDTFNTENVEVLKGPASVLFGRGSTGGIVNQESKKPKLEKSVDGALSFGTDNTKRATLDVNRPLSLLGENTAFRLNLVGNTNGVAGRDVAEIRRFGLAPSLAFGINSQTRTTLSFLHLSSNDTPDYGIPYLLSKPAPVKRTNYYGFRNSNFLKTDVDMVTLAVERDFDSSTSLRNQLRFAKYSRNAQITEGQISTAVTANTPLNNISVTRNQITAISTETTLDNDLSLKHKFETLGVQHTLLTGFEFIRETSDPIRKTFTGVPTTSLLNPDPNQSFAGTSTTTSNVNTTLTTFAPYLMDSLALHQKWDLLLGARWDWLSTQYKQSVAPGADFSRIDRMLSWRSGLVFKPTAQGNIYFNYGTSFNPSAEQLALATNTTNVSPEKNQIFELGSKWNLLNNQLSLQGAIFHNEKTNARTPDPTNSLLNVLSGSQQVDGFEIGATGRPSPRLQIFTGYTFLKSKVTSSNRPGEVGSPLTNTPTHTANLWTTYTVTSIVDVGGGFNTVSSRAGNTIPDTNTGLIKEVQGYWKLDLMAKVQVASDIDAQLNLYNVFDHFYFDGIHPAHLIPGAGRTLLLTTHFKL